MSALNTLAQRSGSLSAGLDSVATWCFSSAGTWTGGVPQKKGKHADPDADPIGDCARAIKSCESARAAITGELPKLLTDSLDDLKRDYLGVVYTPKRSGLAERPTEAANCFARVRSELFTQAQARMDLARLASQVQSEYRGYRKWLLTESMRCAQLVRAGKKDQLRRGIAVDTPTGPAGKGDLQLPNQGPPPGGDTTNVAIAQDVGAQGPAAGSGTTRPPGAGTTTSPGTGVAKAGTSTTTPGTSGATVGGGTAPGNTAVALPVQLPAMTSLPGGSTGTSPSSLPVGGPTTERERALAGPPLQKWQYFARQRTQLETDPDFTPPFLSSWELRSCRCPRVSPNAVVVALQSDAGAAQLLANDPANTRCELCLLDAYAVWKTRAAKQCKLMESLSEYELGVLERSDDGNGLPPRCFEEARKRLKTVATGPASTATSPPPTHTNGRTVPIGNPQVVAGPITTGGLPPANQQVVITRTDPQPPPTTALPPGNWQTVSSPIADSFARNTDYAPVPVREEGRLYVRTFMSSGCTADVLPGPMSARTGDLLLLPPNPPMLQVKMPCGGLVEVYWGREAKPRVSEIIGRNQPLQLQFRRQ